MATITGNRVDGMDGVARITWSTITTSDVAQAAKVSDLYERTIHVYSAGAGTAQLRGSNDGTNFVNIGSALAANTLTQMAVNPDYVDFSPIGAATVTIVLVGKRKP